MSSATDRKNHVCFGSEDCYTRNNSIVVKRNSHDLIQIHLGFLQFNHIYKLFVEIPKSYFMGYDIRALLEAVENSSPNLYSKVLSIEEKSEVYEFLIEFHAEKERLLKEVLKLRLHKDVTVRLELNARVLGPGKGTPLLKNGIKCVGVVRDELSEASDWQE